MATWDGYNQKIIANRFQKSFMVNYIDLSGRLLVRQDASFNNRLFVMNDASFMGNVYVDENLITNLKLGYNRDAQMNRLFVMNDASFMGNLYVDGVLTTNSKLILNNDTSLNNNVIVGKDISCNANISIGRNLTILGNIAIQNYTATNVINTTTTNYQLVVSEDISLNGRLSVSSDTSLNGNLFVSKDISLNGNCNINGTIKFVNDISINGMNLGGNTNKFSTFYGNLAANDGSYNTLVGHKSFTVNPNTAGYCTGFGFQTGLASTGIHNTAVGYQSLSTTTTGGLNTGMGYNSGINNTSGANNTFIGVNTESGGGTHSNSTAIGANAWVSASNYIILGMNNASAQTLIIPRIERFLTPPILIRTLSSAVSIPHNTNTVILWGTSNYAGSTNISYNSTTGVFSNALARTISVSVSASFCYLSNVSGVRSLWVQHSTYGRVGHYQNSANISTTNPDVTGLFITCRFPMAYTDTFTISTFQNSGAALTAAASYNVNHPCRVFITVNM